MSRVRGRLAKFVLRMLTAAAMGGPYEDGVAAAYRGDYVAALRLLRPLAEQGDALAQYNLGVIYDKGHGVPQNHTEALKWYGKAAEQGFAEAQYNLGLMYHDGRGVPQDYVQAHLWFNLAASTGLKRAVKNRKLAADKMTPAQIAEAQKLAREWKPKTQGGK